MDDLKLYGKDDNELEGLLRRHVIPRNKWRLWHSICKHAREDQEWSSREGSCIPKFSDKCMKQVASYKFISSSGCYLQFQSTEIVQEQNKEDWQKDP